MEKEKQKKNQKGQTTSVTDNIFLCFEVHGASPRLPGQTSRPPPVRQTCAQVPSATCQVAGSERGPGFFQQQCPRLRRRITPLCRVVARDARADGGKILGPDPPHSACYSVQPGVTKASGTRPWLPHLWVGVPSIGTLVRQTSKILPPTLWSQSQGVTRPREPPALLSGTHESSKKGLTGLWKWSPLKTTVVTWVFQPLTPLPCRAHKQTTREVEDGLHLISHPKTTSQCPCHVATNKEPAEQPLQLT